MISMKDDALSILTFTLTSTTFKSLQKHLQYWLKVLKSGQRRMADKLKIMILATHLDAFAESSEGNNFQQAK